MAKDNVYLAGEKKIKDALKSGATERPNPASPKSDDMYYESAYIVFLVVFGGGAREASGEDGQRL
jgi:hypothetical protein